MDIVWTEHAVQRRREIFIYIAADNIDAARKLDEDFQQAAMRLSRFRIWDATDMCREPVRFVVRNAYILVYRIVADTLQKTLTIHHAVRKHPPL